MIKQLNYSHARAHPGCKVRSHGTESTCIVGLSVLCHGQPDGGESCIMLRSRPTLASLLSFCSVQSSLAVREFHAAGEECCKQGHGRVCDAWCRGAQSASEQFQLCELSGPTFRYAMQEFSLLGCYMENSEKLSKLVGGACLGQYSHFAGTNFHELIKRCILWIKVLWSDMSSFLFSTQLTCKTYECKYHWRLSKPKADYSCLGGNSWRATTVCAET